MKLFTRSFATLAMLAMSLATAFAANITINVGDNFYRGPGNTSGVADIRTINVGDVVTWHNVGFSSHPTMSDNGAWSTFPMNPGSPDFTRTFSTVGSFPYHCTAHGGPGSGQYGVLNVVATPTATLADANLAAATLNVFPNPSHGQVTVKLEQKGGADYKLRLSNIIGQEIRTIALKPELTAAGLPLDLSDLRTGVYFYSLLVDGKVASTKRLVLQN
ncbi:T9SS type A sorting domain-containing protein [Hymenobacter negativus]|uniref:T9SS type A sorting domain-containing protein n=1 Tax=Hymenobacter negativus TaxID=2795026 RepID=A0ABS3QGE3_9BACT|nr:T9SS type A sorting domain-containing protein [Hymenobacter negativus]MBO2010316.1 T9SS type A sorting domain-containing protein [Hymenobacter negativus]